MASQNSLAGAVRETSTEGLALMLASLEKLTSAKALDGQPAHAHLDRIREDISGELARRQLADEGISTSPFSTHVIGQMLAHWLARYKETKTGYYSYYSKSENKTRFVLSSRAKFAAELRMSGVGAASRSPILDEALNRVHGQLILKTKHEKKPFPLQEIDPDLFELAERLQRVIIFAQMTGTEAVFEWDVHYHRYIRYSFDRDYSAIEAPVSGAKATLAKAVAAFEKAAKLAPPEK